MDNRTNTFAFLYKLSSLAVGLIVIFLGYNLFRIGFVKPAGDLQAWSGDRSIELTHAAPGVFFALFGAFVIGVTIYKGLQFAQTQTNEQPTLIIALAQQEWRNMAAAVNGLEGQGKLQGQDLLAVRIFMTRLGIAIFPAGQVPNLPEVLGPVPAQEPALYFRSTSIAAASAAAAGGAPRGAQ
jgi:hypothetical protein